MLIPTETNTTGALHPKSMIHMKQKTFYVRVVVDGYGPSFEFKVVVRVNTEHLADYTARPCAIPQRVRHRLKATSREIGYWNQHSAAIGAVRAQVEEPESSLAFL